MKRTMRYCSILALTSVSVLFSIHASGQATLTDAQKKLFKSIQQSAQNIPPSHQKFLSAHAGNILTIAGVLINGPKDQGDGPTVNFPGRSALAARQALAAMAAPVAGGPVRVSDPHS